MVKNFEKFYITIRQAEWASEDTEMICLIPAKSVGLENRTSLSPSTAFRSVGAHRGPHDRLDSLHVLVPNGHDENSLHASGAARNGARGVAMG